MALSILTRAYRSGALQPGDTIAEATSGNAGIALAALGRALGHPVEIFMPDWMSDERKSLLRSLTEPERETLASYALHYQQTVLSGRLPDLKLFHYADMIRGPRRAVQGLARAAGIDAAPAVIDVVTDATSFGAMKANAATYAPGGGTGIWKNEGAFFDAGTSGKCEGQLSREDLDLYADRFAALIPDRAARHWLENGAG